MKLTFTEEGSNQFADITSNHIGEQLAIIIDGKLVSTLVINTEINEGSCVITGNSTKKETESYTALFNE